MGGEGAMSLMNASIRQNRKSLRSQRRSFRKTTSTSSKQRVVTREMSKGEGIAVAKLVKETKERIRLVNLKAIIIGSIITAILCLVVF